MADSMFEGNEHYTELTSLQLACHHLLNHQVPLTIGMRSAFLEVFPDLMVCCRQHPPAEQPPRDQTAGGKWRRAGQDAHA